MTGPGSPEFNDGVRAALDRLDGTDRAAIALLSDVDVTDLDTYGGTPPAPSDLPPPGEVVYETDDVTGRRVPAALHYAGHLDDDVALTAAQRDLPGSGISTPYGIDPPRRRWVWKVTAKDGSGGFTYVYGRRTKRRDSQPVTVIEPAWED